MRGSFAHVEGVQGKPHSAQITVEFWTTSSCKRPQGFDSLLPQHPTLYRFAQVWTSVLHSEFRLQYAVEVWS